ncbi:hypothetical protein PR048_031990 [Dryococelus australis]|uniref:DDE-1 domain-containing protein n=1 Tax=Dryococelus australis TaxID=614101 RepID=A0ABQ9G9H8_9NEOP|nr:hypothetical protein PR048_031990 [Dryococelus australis]
MMAQKYRSRLGHRRYANYSAEIFERCLDDVKSGKLCQRKASDKYNIPITTLKNELKNSHTKKPGGQNIFSEVEEESFVKHLVKMSEFWFPIYKADHIWLTWEDHGPEGARYNQTKSGWFDTVVFEDWFTTRFLPHTRHLEGPIVLIGDNLSSHINTDILNLREQSNIKFICLPPASHKTQPLDVAFAGPLKRAWRLVLSKWHDTEDGSKHPTIPEEKLPALLKELLLAIQPNQKHLISGFKKCGLVPVEKQILLHRLPNKRRKVNVPPGKSITVQDVSPKTSTDERQSKGTSSASKKKEISAMVVAVDEEETTSEESDADMILESDMCSEDFTDSGDVDVPASSEGGQKTCVLGYKVDNFVIVSYNSSNYPGQIEEINEAGPIVNCWPKGRKCTGRTRKIKCNIPGIVLCKNEHSQTCF